MALYILVYDVREFGTAKVQVPLATIRTEDGQEASYDAALALADAASISPEAAEPGIFADPGRFVIALLDVLAAESTTLIANDICTEADGSPDASILEDDDLSLVIYCPAEEGKVSHSGY